VDHAVLETQEPEGHLHVVAVRLVPLAEWADLLFAHSEPLEDAVVVEQVGALQCHHS